MLLCIRYHKHDLKTGSNELYGKLATVTSWQKSIYNELRELSPGLSLFCVFYDCRLIYILVIFGKSRFLFGSTWFICFSRRWTLILTKLHLTRHQLGLGLICNPGLRFWGFPPDAYWHINTARQIGKELALAQPCRIHAWSDCEWDGERGLERVGVESRGWRGKT